MLWLNNPWVIGIGGGILSGLVVTFFSRLILSRRDSGEYTQKLHVANREVIYALRPGVSEGHVPGRSVVLSIINATGRKYSVDTGDMMTPEQISEELTKEIMDSSFISAGIKQEYCKQLAPLTDLESVLVGETEHGSRPWTTARSNLADYRRRMVALLSVMMGATTAIMTMSLTISDDLSGATIDSIELLLPTVVALLAILLATILMVVRRRLPYRIDDRRGRRRHREKDSEIDRDE